MKKELKIALYAALVAGFLSGIIYVWPDRPLSDKTTGPDERRLALIPEGYKLFDANEVAFSADGQQVAYSAGKDGLWHVFVNDQKGRAYKNIWKPVVNPGDRTVWYVGQRTGIKKRKIVIVSGDRESRMYDDTGGDIRFSPDGKRHGYAARVGEEWFAVIDGKQGNGYSLVWAPWFSPDGKRSAYAAKDKGTMFIVVDGEAGQRYDSVGEPFFSPEGRHIAFRAEENKKWFIVVNGREGRRYDYIWTPPVFSPDGMQVAYGAKKGNKSVLVSSAVASPSKVKEGKIAYDMVASPLFSPDGRRMASIGINGALNDRQRIVINGSEGPVYQEISFLVISPDSTRVAYTAMKEGKRFVVMSLIKEPAGAKEGPAYDMVVSPVFSPDGSTLVYRARKKGRRFVVIADNTGAVIRKGPEYEAVWPPRFSADGTSIGYGAGKLREIWWEVETLE